MALRLYATENGRFPHRVRPMMAASIGTNVEVWLELLAVTMIIQHFNSSSNSNAYLSSFAM